MCTGLICGCFDLFHVGHLNILEKCKQNCDYLLVGVCNDDYIITRKHKVPIISEDDRLRIIQALKCVDEAVLVNDEIIQNRLQFCKEHNVSIIFDGDDWKNNARYDSCIKNGIRMQYFPYTQRYFNNNITRETK